MLLVRVTHPYHGRVLRRLSSSVTKAQRSMNRHMPSSHFDPTRSHPCIAKRLGQLGSISIGKKCPWRLISQLQALRCGSGRLPNRKTLPKCISGDYLGVIIGRNVAYSVLSGSSTVPNHRRTTSKCTLCHIATWPESVEGKLFRSLATLHNYSPP